MSGEWVMYLLLFKYLKVVQVITGYREISYTLCHRYFSVSTELIKGLSKQQKR